ncbi:MATE family efflux transporter [Psychromonas marina]|uniref:MATE family efflux transporter n=1 Tax=Psychromonas marina TaxID=88364 RepID=A0ABQ6E1M3_9GAMM|nr:MATE family efflux transporter [Psychromonas marina]GLS91331.1 MATE family efflux transporter [Psychromonas marina]
MQTPAKFLSGSILKHVISMSTTNAVGLIAIFMVDLADIYFISLLHDTTYTAAIGYASAILFFITAIGIGLTIANSAITSKYIGQQQHYAGRRYISHISLFTTLFSVLITFIIWLLAPRLLSYLGAENEVLTEATNYLRIIILSLPILALSMQMSASLRCFGHAKHAMYVTLLAAIVNALLDPLFIFVVGLDLQGAAIASLIARIIAFGLSVFYVAFRYKLIAFPTLSGFLMDTKIIINVAFPAILTQIATPLGNLYVTYEVAKFGTEYIAGWAIIGRLIPVAFALMFAVSGAIAPIIGQNYGANNFKRLRQILTESIKFMTTYCLVISLFLSLGQEIIVNIFNAQNETAQIIRIFCQHISITFIFTGITLVCMAFLNNLGYAKYATLLNLGKVSFGTVPFVSIGAIYFSAPGILYGQALGTIVFAAVALMLMFHILNMIETNEKADNKLEKADQSSTN